jgi:hypothetical protein
MASDARQHVGQPSQQVYVVELGSDDERVDVGGALSAEERLQVKCRMGRKRALGTRRPMAVPSSQNQRWSLDFLADSFAEGSAFA